MGNGEGDLREPPETPLDPHMLKVLLFSKNIRQSSVHLQCLQCHQYILTNKRNATSKFKAMSHSEINVNLDYF